MKHHHDNVTQGWLERLERELADRRATHVYRELRRVEGMQDTTLTVEGVEYLQFCTNNYLGLAGEPAVVEAVREATARWGAGAGASRLVAGSMEAHHRLEEELAAFKGTEAALVCSTGFMANLAALMTFAGPGDRIVSDKLNHASLLDAARFSGAECRVFPHLHYGRAEALLGKGGVGTVTEGVSSFQFPVSRDEGGATDAATRRHGDAANDPSKAPSLNEGSQESGPSAEHASPAPLPRTSMAPGATVEGWPLSTKDLGLSTKDSGNWKLETGNLRFLVTDTVFSMDGDVANLPACCAVAQRRGALVIVDEAHGTGVLGEHGRGLGEAQGVEDRLALTVGTLSKAFGSVGGFIAGPRAAIEMLINTARTFIYTTALPPGCSAGALAALAIIRGTEGKRRRERLQKLAAWVRRELRSLGYDLGDASGSPEAPAIETPIIPVILGEAATAVRAANQLRDRGLWVPAIRPPTVPPHKARLRISLMATHTDAQVERLIEEMKRLKTLNAER